MRCCRICLRKGVENLLLFVLGDTCSRIGNGKTDWDEFVRGLEALRPHAYLPFLCELDGVTRKIDKNLSQAGGIAQKDFRDSARQCPGNFQLFLLSTNSQRLQCALDAIQEGEGDTLKIQPTGFDL